MNTALHAVNVLICIVLLVMLLVNWPQQNMLSLYRVALQTADFAKPCNDMLCTDCYTVQTHARSVLRLEASVHTAARSILLTTAGGPHWRSNHA